jgi:hypothetical protein
MNSRFVQHNNNNNKPTTAEDNAVRQALAGGVRIYTNSYSYSESQQDALFLRFI